VKSQLEAAEMWSLRRMLRIAWTDKVCNQQVLVQVQVINKESREGD